MNRNGDYKMGEQSLVCGQTNQQDSLQQNCVCERVCMHVYGWGVCKTFSSDIQSAAYLYSSARSIKRPFIKDKKGKFNTFE